MIQCIITFLLIIVFFYILNNSLKKNILRESFSDEKPYLYPIKGLEPQCAKDNLLPSYMPKACYVNGVLNNYANCKCEDNEGNCKICYETIKKDSKNSSVVYDASKNMKE
jgi:hypothetical protein